MNVVAMGLTHPFQSTDPEMFGGRTHKHVSPVRGCTNLLEAIQLCCRIFGHKVKAFVCSNECLVEEK